MSVFAFYVHSGTIRDKAVRFATGHQASHVEYVVGGVLKTQNVCIAASKRDGNVVRSKAIKWRAGHWRFIQVPGDDQAVYQRLITKVKAPYDTWGAVLSVTPFCWHRQDAWFCFELALHGLGQQRPHRGGAKRLIETLMRMGGEEIKLEENSGLYAYKPA